MLFFFSRLPLRPYQRRLHKIFAVLSGLTYVAVVLTITLSCLPFDMGWTAIPYPPPKCSVRAQLFYTINISNAATDIAILTVALPLLWQLRTSLQRKVELTLLLCSGIFVTTACLTSFFMSMTNPGSMLNISLWGTREEIAGIVAVNAPMIRPMFRKSFWERDFDPSRRRARLPPAARPRLARGRRVGFADKHGGESGRKAALIAMLSRRLGVLTSIQSQSSHLSTKPEHPMSGTTLQAPTTVGSQRIDEDEFKDLEWAWAVHGAVLERWSSVPKGPRPLLPDPAGSYSSQGTTRPLGGLQSISEEEEPIGIAENIVDPTGGHIARTPRLMSPRGSIRLDLARTCTNARNSP